jgi:4,5-dihydroxyphthalate decarboxylase
MTNLALSVAVGDYDRTRALLDGSVCIDGVNPVVMMLSPEEIFFRAFRHTEFDICELSLSSFCVTIANGDSSYVGVPAFVSRAFRHTSIYVRRDRIKSASDLKGRKIGLPEYQLTANVWARAILEDDHGIKPTDVIWVRGAIEQPGRPEKVSVNLPPNVRLENAPEGTTISGMLDRGEIDGFMAPRPPSCAATNPNVGWLFQDPTKSAKDYYARTRIFPIMHLVGVRRRLVEQHPWLPAAVLKAFELAKAAALRELADTSATKVTLPFVEEQLKAAQDLMGADFWSYGVSANRHTIDAFLRHHHGQGLSSRRLTVEELFHPGTLESPRV